MKDDEDVENTFINKRTMFLDKKNKRIVIKEIDGSISEEYEVVLPLDEKDKKIIELEKRLKEMEEKINDEHSKPVRTNDEQQKSDANAYWNVKSTAEANGGTISKPVERETSRTDSKNV